MTWETLFLKNLMQNVVQKLFPDPFLKNQKWVNILKSSCRTIAFTLCKAFLRNKKRSGTSLPASFSAWNFLHSKIFMLLYSINWPNFIVWLPLLCEILGNMCIVVACEPDCDVINFEINLIFLIKPFFLHGKKVKTKI